MVKLTLPITAHHEDIDLKAPDISHFLIPVVLREDPMHMPQRLHDFSAIAVGDHAVFALDGIELVARHTNKQLIPKGGGAFQNAGMTDMEQIKGSIGQNPLGRSQIRQNNGHSLG